MSTDEFSHHLCSCFENDVFSHDRGAWFVNEQAKAFRKLRCAEMVETGALTASGTNNGSPGQPGGRHLASIRPASRRRGFARLVKDAV